MDRRLGVRFRRALFFFDNMSGAVFDLVKSQRWDRMKRYAPSSSTHFIQMGLPVYPCINDEQEQNELLEAVARDVQSGVKMSVHEYISPVFRLFFHADFLVPGQLRREEIEQLAHLLFVACGRFFPDGCSARSVPTLFECIFLHADPPALCSNRHELCDLLHPRVCSTDGEIHVNSVGQILDKDTDEFEDVEWIASAHPSRGRYPIRIEDDTVVVRDTPFSFKNRKLVNRRLVRLDPADAGAAAGVPARDETDAAAGQWQHTARTVFSLDDGGHFLNAKRDAGGLIKYGLHIVFPEIFVDTERALYMRQGFLEILESKMRDSHLAPAGWEHVINHEVYETGKYVRWAFSDKWGNCAECRGARRGSDCLVSGCVGGKVSEGRPYELHSVYVNGAPSREREDAYRAKPKLLLLKTSIRTPSRATLDGWKLYEGCPKLGTMLTSKVSTGGDKIYKVTSKKPVFKGEGNHKRAKSTGRLIDDARSLQLLEGYIRRLVGVYRNLRVSRVWKRDNGPYMIDVEGDGRHRCFNMSPPQDHPNSTIYFQCDHRGLGQRCYCKDPDTTNRINGPCGNFLSSCITLDRTDAAYLFPEKVQKAN